MEWIFAIAILLFFAAVFLFGGWMQKKRREELAAWGQQAGLNFAPDRTIEFETLHPSFDCLRRGDNRYAYNVLSGEWNGYPVSAFDYHYETESRDSKGHRRKNTHIFSAVILRSAVPLQHLQIRAETIFDKVAQAVGFDDIDFESAEFSRKFMVKAKDRKWAYAVIHPRTMEFLLTSPIFSLLFDTTSVMAWRDRQLSAREIEQAANVACGLLQRLPEYLIQQQAPRPPLLPESS